MAQATTEIVKYSNKQEEDKHTDRTNQNLTIIDFIH